MAFFASIRRAAPSAPLLAASLCRNLWNHNSFAFLGRRTTKDLLFQQTLGSRRDLGFSPQITHFSSVPKKPASDVDLIKVIEAEIKCAEEYHDLVDEIPEGYPFEIQDEKGMNTVTLKRTYEDENVKVIVSMPSLVTGEEPEDIRDPDDDGAKTSNQSSIPLTVVVDKGSDQSLEFSCTAYPDEVVIDVMSIGENKDMIAYEGPDFSDLDENLQKAFHKYLELRGMTPMTTNFLHEYMINKDSREFLFWLKDLKQFVEK